MLVSFAAAVQGGVAMETEIMEEKEKTKSTTAKASGRIGFNKLFQSLFDASIDMSVEREGKSGSLESRKESKAHTEASIAILLYHELVETGGYILQPDNVNDLDTYNPGTLVEVAGRVEKNAIDQMIDYIDAINILSNLDTSTLPTKKTGAKNNRGKQHVTPILDNNLTQIRNSLDTDRKRTPISNVVVRCDSPADLNVIVTLRTENLRDLTLSELDKNSVRIIGKITRVIPKGEAISSFENYGMALLSPKLLNEVFDDLKKTEDFAGKFSDIQVSGPAWQILPLMVFV